MPPITLFPKQDQFIYSNCRYSGYGGGFGNGKTMSGAIKAFTHCQQPNAYFLIGRRHATDLRDSTLRDFLQLFGHTGKFSPGRQSFAFYNNGQKTGSEIIFRHLDDLQSLTNMNLSGFWIDQAEEVSEGAFDFLIGRLRRPVDRREGFITFNMNGHDWIWRRFKKKLGSDGNLLPNHHDYQLVEASTLENQKNLPQDYIDALLAMPDEYKKRYVYGSWDVFAGQIFDEFNPTIHVIPRFQVPTTWERLRGIDHGQNNPTACLWAAIDYDGNMYIYDEYYQPSAPVSQHVARIKEMSKMRLDDGAIRDDLYAYTVIDPSTHAKTREKDGHLYSVADEYLDAGISTLKAQNDVIAGINRTKEFLKIDPLRYHPFLKSDDGESIMGAPRLFIFEHCTNLIEELQQYRWKQESILSGNPNTDDVKERPVKRHDHAVDALRYLVMSRHYSPVHGTFIEPWVYENPLELARRAGVMGKTVDDLLYERYNMTTIRKSSTGIKHQTGFN